MFTTNLTNGIMQPLTQGQPGPVAAGLQAIITFARPLGSPGLRGRSASADIFRHVVRSVNPLNLLNRRVEGNARPRRRFSRTPATSDEPQPSPGGQHAAAHRLMLPTGRSLQRRHRRDRLPSVHTAGPRSPSARPGNIPASGNTGHGDYQLAPMLRSQSGPPARPVKEPDQLPCSGRGYTSSDSSTDST
jgi:hypothetical protein